jgi:hypothetical protein
MRSWSVLISVSFLVGQMGLGSLAAPFAFQDSQSPLTLFATDVQTRDLGDGWQSVNVTLGLRNDGTDPQEVSLGPEVRLCPYSSVNWVGQ